MLLCGVALATSADEVSLESARFAAQAWIDSGLSLGKLRGRCAAQAETLEEGDARMHVVKLDGGGFVVMGADDLVEPVIAFSAGGAPVDADSAGPLPEILKADLAERARAAARRSASAGRTLLGASSGSGGAERTATQRRWDALLAGGSGRRRLLASDDSNGLDEIPDVRVEPFVKSRWGQENNSMYYGEGEPCFNYYTPNNYPCGCVATAIAQILRYHRYPASVTQKTFTCEVDGSSVSKTMMGGTYDYDGMPLVPESYKRHEWYEGGATEAERQEIGKLVYDCAVAMRMKWWPGYGSSFGGFAHDPLQKVFSYASAKSYLDSSSTGIKMNLVLQTMMPNLDAKCPVMVGLDGHEVLADGYGYSGETLYVHLNMGWAGWCDVWYALPDVIPNDQYESHLVNSVVYNIFPEATGDLLSGRVTYPDGAPNAGAVVHAYTTNVPRRLVATARTDSRGIYSLLISGASSSGTQYLVSASNRAEQVSRRVTLKSAVGPSYVNLESGSYMSNAMTAGNSWGNNFVLARPDPLPTVIRLR